MLVKDMVRENCSVGKNGIVVVHGTLSSPLAILSWRLALKLWWHLVKSKGFFSKFLGFSFLPQRCKCLFVFFFLSATRQGLLTFIYLINSSCALSFTHDFSLHFLIIILKGRVPEQVLPRSRLQVPAFFFQTYNKWTVGGVIA